MKKSVPRWMASVCSEMWEKDCRTVTVLISAESNWIRYIRIVESQPIPWRWKKTAIMMAAMDTVRQKGYGMVLPEKEEIRMEDPVLIHQSGKFGVKLKAYSPSVHMIRANIETEIAPIVGSEEQAKDLIQYIQEGRKQEDGIWQINIFGKTIEELVEDGIRSKLYQIGEESQVKLQDTMQKIVNDSNGGLVCIII